MKLRMALIISLVLAAFQSHTVANEKKFYQYQTLGKQTSLSMTQGLYQDLRAFGLAEEKKIKSQGGEVRCNESKCLISVDSSESDFHRGHLSIRGTLAKQLYRSLDAATEVRSGALSRTSGDLTCVATMSLPQRHICRWVQLEKNPAQ